MASATRSSDALPCARVFAASAHKSATETTRERFMQETLRSAADGVEWRASRAEPYLAPLNVHADLDEVRRPPGLPARVPLHEHQLRPQGRREGPRALRERAGFGGRGGLHPQSFSRRAGDPWPRDHSRRPAARDRREQQVQQCRDRCTRARECAPNGGRGGEGDRLLGRPRAGQFDGRHRRAAGDREDRTRHRRARGARSSRIRWSAPRGS